MFKKFDVNKMDHYAKHLTVVSLVVFLLVMNLFMFNYAAAASGSEIDTSVNQTIVNIVDNYEISADYMYDYSVVWGELLLGWEDFIVDTYYMASG